MKKVRQIFSSIEQETNLNVIPSRVIFGSCGKNDEDVADRRRDEVDATVILGDIQDVSVRPLDIAGNHPLPLPFAHGDFVKDAQLESGRQNQRMVEVSVQIWQNLPVDSEISPVNQQLSGSFDVTKQNASDADWVVKMGGVREGASLGEFDAVRPGPQRKPFLPLVDNFERIPHFDDVPDRHAGFVLNLELLRLQVLVGRESLRRVFADIS